MSSKPYNKTSSVGLTQAGGSSSGFNGTLHYFGVTVNGVEVRDYRMDEGAGTTLVDATGTVANATVSLTSGHLAWVS